jgi:hypothetical protein
MGDSDKNQTSRFYVYVGQGDLSPSNVFFDVEDEQSARDLCKLFADEYGEAGGIVFNYKALPSDSLSEDVRLCEALDDLRLYDDPDPGLYDPPPSRQTLVRAEYSRRARIWADLIQQRITGVKKPAASPVPQVTQNAAANADVQALESIRRLLEKHRLIFLYFAVPKRVNPLNHDSQWETLRDDKFPQVPSEDIDSEGEFLFLHRRKFENFAQAAVGQFGTGLGNKPRTMNESGKVVDVEGGSYPFWMLDETACVYLDESADKILEVCRKAVRHGSDRLLSRFVQRIKLALHDEGQTKWYASNLVRWSFLMRLDDALHALKLAELESCSVSEDQQPATDEKEGDVCRQGDEETPEASELPELGDIPPMSEEDDRNSGLLLLMMLAQAYYKMLEATVSMASWLTALDMELNHCYLWTIQNLANLLKNHKHLKDFPGSFEPALPDLYPSTIADLEWQDMIAPGVEEFLATVQKYVIAKGSYQPEEKSPAWIMVELFRPSIERAIECAENHHKRLRQAQRRLLGEPIATKATQPNGAPTPDVTTKPIVPTPKGAKWTDLSIKVIDGETVAIKVGDHARRYVYSEMGMIDGRTKKPTKQWELLQHFARNHGILTWQSSGADRKNQKRREVLSENLKAVFGIEGEPIVLTDDKKGWRTTFSINPDT